MPIVDSLRHLFDAIPREEHVHLLRFLQYQLTVLSLMPAQQRYHEYARAEQALTHYETYEYPKRPEHG